MVERPQQKDDVVRRIGGRQLACVADFHGAPRPLDGLVEVQLDGVDQVDAVAVFGEPLGVRAWASADVQYHGRGRWQVPTQ